MIDYDAFNHEVFSQVPANAINILDIGCGTGIMGKVLKDQNPLRKVYGLTYSNTEREVAIQVLDEVWVADINNSIPNFNDKYDCIILSHILEHTFYPDKVLKQVSGYLKPGGTVIVALPNILMFRQRAKFLLGKFKYSPNGGLMDDTHFRFFDWETAQEMITSAGLKITNKQSAGNFPLGFIRKLMFGLGAKADKFALKKWPGLFGFQFIFTATNA